LFQKVSGDSNDRVMVAADLKVMYCQFIVLSKTAFQEALNALSLVYFERYEWRDG